MVEVYSRRSSLLLLAYSMGEVEGYAEVGYAAEGQ
jgi:hypothetical protein